MYWSVLKDIAKLHSDAKVRYEIKFRLQRYVIVMFGYQRTATALSLGKFARRTRRAVRHFSLGKKREMPKIFFVEKP